MFLGAERSTNAKSITTVVCGDGWAKSELKGVSQRLRDIWLVFCLFGLVVVVAGYVLFIFIQINIFVYNHSCKIIFKNTANFFASSKYISQL